MFNFSIILDVAYFETSALDNKDKNINKGFLKLVESNNNKIFVLNHFCKHSIN